MSYDFQVAQPIKIQGTGRKAEPNPFLEAVQNIALKTDDEGTPIALSFTESVDLDNPPKDQTSEGVYKALCIRIGHKLTAAGNDCKPPVTVRRNFEKTDELDNALTIVRVTFWTIPKKSR